MLNRFDCVHTLFVVSTFFAFLCILFPCVFSAGETTADRSSRIAKKRILESHLLHSERHMVWESRSGERDLKLMLRSLALEHSALQHFSSIILSKQQYKKYLK